MLDQKFSFFTHQIVEKMVNQGENNFDKLGKALRVEQIDRRTLCFYLPKSSAVTNFSLNDFSQLSPPDKVFIGKILTNRRKPQSSSGAVFSASLLMNSNDIRRFHLAFFSRISIFISSNDTQTHSATMATTIPCRRKARQKKFFN